MRQYYPTPKPTTTIRMSGGVTEETTDFHDGTFMIRATVDGFRLSIRTSNKFYNPTKTKVSVSGPGCDGDYSKFPQEAWVKGSPWQNEWDAEDRRAIKARKQVIVDARSALEVFHMQEVSDGKLSWTWNGCGLGSCRCSPVHKTEKPAWVNVHDGEYVSARPVEWLSIERLVEEVN